MEIIHKNSLFANNTSCGPKTEAMTCVFPCWKNAEPSGRVRTPILHRTFRISPGRLPSNRNPSGDKYSSFDIVFPHLLLPSFFPRNKKRFQERWEARWVVWCLLFLGLNNLKESLLQGHPLSTLAWALSSFTPVEVPLDRIMKFSSAFHVYAMASTRKHDELGIRHRLSQKKGVLRSHLYF